MKGVTASWEIEDWQWWAHHISEPGFDYSFPPPASSCPVQCCASTGEMSSSRCFCRFKGKQSAKNVWLCWKVGSLKGRGVCCYYTPAAHLITATSGWNKRSCRSLQMEPVGGGCLPVTNTNHHFSSEMTSYWDWSRRGHRNGWCCCCWLCHCKMYNFIYNAWYSKYRVLPKDTLEIQ